MLKKSLYVLLILCLILFVSNIAYGADILMDLNTNINSTDTTNEIVDNTTYSNIQEEDSNTTDVNTVVPDYDYTVPTTSTTTDYEDSAELSISNMINIVLIVVGVVLILLGIAIIIKLK